MRLARLNIDGYPRWTEWRDGRYFLLNHSLDAWLSGAGKLESDGEGVEGHLLAPLESQEVWASGVTYRRSREAREHESQVADVYERVYTAERPELFFKATASRTAAPGEAVGIRSDAHWNVPEPELALILNAKGEIVAYTIGNDMSSRDIEGENPLYLPQAKVYDLCLGLGPHLVTADEVSSPQALHVALEITRQDRRVFQGETTTAEIQRRLEDLAGYLFRSQRFPVGAVLLTGTGIVPPDDFSLQAGDLIRIGIEGLGVLENSVKVI
ncbi:fumarylacetoacetate hydrolase family protein (plasmid) [Deinococcus radiomollis]|uniref:fumarylacetoacetate hydrolase family protein n=1 Tax=Deinococcus radiomollis TaxID=468916 RepID=UPI00389222CF